MTDPVRQDWPQIIREIEAMGVTLYKISLMMHRQYTQVKRWRDGAEPRYHEGVMLLMIHAEYVSRKTLQVSPSQQQNEIVKA